MARWPTTDAINIKVRRNHLSGRDGIAGFYMQLSKNATISPRRFYTVEKMARSLQSVMMKQLVAFWVMFLIIPAPVLSSSSTFLCAE